MNDLCGLCLSKFLAICREAMLNESEFKQRKGKERKGGGGGREFCVKWDFSLG